MLHEILFRKYTFDRYQILSRVRKAIFESNLLLLIKISDFISYYYLKILIKLLLPLYLRKIASLLNCY